MLEEAKDSMGGNVRSLRGDRGDLGLSDEVRFSGEARSVLSGLGDSGKRAEVGDGNEPDD